MGSSGAPGDERRRVRRARIRFALTFTASAGVLFGLYTVPSAAHGVSERWFTAYLGLYARLAGAVLRLWDSSVRVNGLHLVGRTTLTIAKHCDAMDVNILFASAVLAFPAAWTRRLLGLATGIALLIAVNLLRIVSLYFVHMNAPRAFDVIHSALWPLAFVALAVGLFVTWSRWAGEPQR